VDPTKKPKFSDFDEEIFFEDGKMYIRRSENIEALLEENNDARNNGTNGYGKSRLWRKIGSIPCIVVEKILREHGVNILDGSPEAEKYTMEFLQKNPKFMTVDKL
jgi:hypothetical protein